MTTKPKFEVDPAGLAQLLERRGKAFAIFELIQNAWDTNARNVIVSLAPVDGRPLAELTVSDDDPEGFDDLNHAYTLFAPSAKRGNAAKRGWINIGEKLVLALCSRATIATTKGTIEFEGNSRTEYPRRKRDVGTRVEARIKMTREELNECCQQMHRLIPPDGVYTSFNGNKIQTRPALASFAARLVTHVADEEGIMRRRARETEVHVYEPHDGEPGTLYELGIPVVETGDTWHVDVQQKVPLNTDRDNVPPSYLRTLRALVANAMRDRLTPEIATQAWVAEAIEDDAIESATVAKTLDERFGKRRFTYDPSDPEANNRLVSQGYTPVYAGSLSGSAWGKVKEFGASTRAGELSPTKHQRFSADGRPMHEIPHEKQTEAERAFVEFAGQAGHALLGFTPSVTLVSDPAVTAGACYGNRGVIFNKFRLGRAWFESRDLTHWMDLIIHEYAHEIESNHLSDAYYKACTKLGAKAFVWALETPELREFKETGQ
jgi:hypothetical protein